jgi:DNA-binding MarR family transcriptional regulator
MFSQHYDEALSSLGLTITQFTILQALSLAGEVSQGRLGEILAMDSTTLTRTLGIMSRRGLIAKRHGNDRRQRQLSLSAVGKTEFGRALPHWHAAQALLRERLGEKRWSNLTHLVNQVTLAVAE